MARLSYLCPKTEERSLLLNKEETMKQFSLWTTISGLMCMALISCSQNTAVMDDGYAEVKKLYEQLPFKMPLLQKPEFPAYELSILDFGAVADGQTINTKAFADAIAQVNEQGGGTVVVPEGLWLTGPIELKNNVRLHTERGAVVLFSKNHEDYPLVQTYYEGQASWRVKSPLSAYGAEHIAITGHGVFDGNGEAWRPVKKANVTGYQWRDFVQSGGVVNERGDMWFPTERSYAGSIDGKAHRERSYEDALAVKEWLRPVMLNFVQCKDVLLEGVSFRNSPAWCLHPCLCEGLILSNIRVKNEEWAANGDALDLESCKNALIYRCSFDAGDDGICMKSGKDAEGRKRGIPTENVIIYDCTVYNGHGGFVVGSEMSGGVRNIYLQKCCFMGTDNGLRFKSTRGRGGVVENIYISDVYMANIKSDVILYDLYYGKRSGSTPEFRPVDEATPAFRDIHMKNIYCNGAGRAILFQGLPEMKLRNITLENAVIEADKGIECMDAEDIVMKNVRIVAPEPVIRMENCERIRWNE